MREMLGPTHVRVTLSGGETREYHCRAGRTVNWSVAGDGRLEVYSTDVDSEANRTDVAWFSPGAWATVERVNETEANAIEIILEAKRLRVEEIVRRFLPRASGDLAQRVRDLGPTPRVPAESFDDLGPSLKDLPQKLDELLALLDEE